MTTEPAIVVEALHKSYGTVRALRGVNLTVQQGEIFGLLGANGAGKTTLIKTLVGSSRPNAGTTRVLGLDPLRQARDLRQQIGYMPQSAVLYDDLSARDNLYFFGRAHRIDHLPERISAVLDFADLRARENDPVHGFSGGMKQRLSLACALVHQPRLLLLDEPTTGVDPKLREAFWAHFRKLTREGATILLSTHQMDEALYCDRLAIMRDGMVLPCDSPRNLLWQGHTTVKIWRGTTLDTETLTNYPEHLPDMLRRYHLDDTITRIEVHEDTLETVVLNLINSKQGGEDGHG